MLFVRHQITSSGSGVHVLVHLSAKNVTMVAGEQEAGKVVLAKIRNVSVPVEHLLHK